MNCNLNQLEETYASMNSEELLELHTKGTLTDEAYEVLENELQHRGENIPPRPSEELKPVSTVGFWKGHWKGQKSLLSAYWVVGVGGNLVTFSLAIIIGLLLTDNLSKTDENFALFIIIVTGIFIPYFVFSCVSIWKCADNVGWKGWGVIARIIVVLWVLRLLTVATGNA